MAGIAGHVKTENDDKTKEKKVKERRTRRLLRELLGISDETGNESESNTVSSGECKAPDVDDKDEEELSMLEHYNEKNPKPKPNVPLLDLSNDDSPLVERDKCQKTDIEMVEEIITKKPTPNCFEGSRTETVHSGTDTEVKHFFICRSVGELDNLTLPKSQRFFYGSGEPPIVKFVDKFIEHFFEVYDSDRRDLLSDLYLEKATFSVVADCHPV